MTERDGGLDRRGGVGGVCVCVCVCGGGGHFSDVERRERHVMAAPVLCQRHAGVGPDFEANCRPLKIAGGEDDVVPTAVPVRQRLECCPGRCVPEVGIVVGSGIIA